MKPRVRLAALANDDETEFLAGALRSARLHRRWVAPPVTRQAFRAKVASMQGPANYAFALRRTDGGDLVGYVEITNVVRGIFRSAYLGYYAFAGHERQGLMREGVVRAIRHAFTDLGLHRLEANVQPGNLASIALVRSCGFSKEGYSPRYLKIRGRWRDHERWALVQESGR
jgi:ribosomal-protein-alanine N-acetyltransferase